MKNMTFLASILAFFALTSCGHDEVALRLAHYNVGAFKKTADSSVEVIADMMKEIGADVVSVNEVDSCAVRTGQVDQLADLAEKMGDWGCHYTAAMPFQGGAYGVGITYDPKLNFVKKDRVGLPKLSGSEPRVLAVTEFEVDLDGENSGTHVVSRSVARDSSHQKFISRIKGNNCCSGHTECDAIIMDDATVSAIPEILAINPDASLIHEAAIGKIAGEQLIKLMTLGLTEKEAEEEIVNGFLR